MAGGMAAPGVDISTYRQQITAMYQQFNPAKLGEIENLLTKYAGQPHVLYAKVCKKYNVPPNAQLASPPAGGMGGGMAAPGGFGAPAAGGFGAPAAGGFGAPAGGGFGMGNPTQG